MLTYRDSIAWQKAMDLAAAVYEVTRTFPKEELFGLTSQLRRASVSVASNIAEGQGRLTAGESAHFPGMARGSVLEVSTQLELAIRFHPGITEDLKVVTDQSVELTKILNAIPTNLRNTKAKPEPFTSAAN